MIIIYDIVVVIIIQICKLKKKKPTRKTENPPKNLYNFLQEIN